jgi:glutamate formiminotransferase
MSYLVIIYVSEGLKLPCFQTLKSQFSSKTALLAHSFKDVVYNRTSFYFVGHDMLSSIYGICNELFSILNFSNHNGLHPTLGAVDHICFSPLGQTQIEQTAVVANEFAKAYAELNEIPVFMYGQASSSGRQLKNLRSELGYFKIDTTENQCPQVSSFYNVLISQGNLRQDYGPLQFNAQKGLTCIGTVPFVLNYNLRFRPQDSKKLVSQITKHVRSETVIQYI